MANVTEQSNWEVGVYQIETSDAVIGGVGGIANRQALQLANRTLWLKNQVAGLGTGKQDADSTLAALANLTTSANQMIYATGADQFALTPLTAFIRTLLDDADAVTALATLGAVPLDGSYKSATPIPSGVDLNNYLTPGDYGQSSNASAVAGSNYPESYAGLLRVRKVGTNIVIQDYQVYNSAKIYTRTFNNGWVYNNGAWSLLSTSADTDSKLSKSGGVMTGALYADGGSGMGTGIKGDTDQDTGWEWPSDGVLQAIVNSVKRVDFNAVSGATSLWTHNGYRLVLQSDGNLVWYSPTNAALWSSSTTYSKTDSDARFAKLAGAVMQGVFCAQSGTGVAAGIKSSGDNDTGIEWPVDGMLQELVDNVIRSKTSSSDQARRFYNGGFETTMQSDGNIVVRNSASAIVSDLYSRAPLASPVFTGTPTAPTAATGTRSTQIATTAFVGAESLIAAPTGSVYTFAGATVPTGWLKCNGAQLSRTTYAALFAVIGTTYGAGDGSTTFALPDLRGEFVRGVDDGRGVDAGRALGSKQGDAIRNMSGEVRFQAVDGSDQLIWLSSGVFSHSADTVLGGHKQLASSASGSWEQILSFSADKVVPTAAENRPRNVAMHYIIKY